MPGKPTKKVYKFFEKPLKPASFLLWLHLRERIPTITQRGWIRVPTRSRRSGNTRPRCRMVHLEVWKDRKDELGKEGQVRIKSRETAERSSRVCKARERESKDATQKRKWYLFYFILL